MNLDDFLVPNSTSSPAGLPEEAPSTTGINQFPALPIKSRKIPTHPLVDNLPASSVPHPSVISNRTGEFDYVKRRVRKTSIDERRVSCILSALDLLCIL